MRHRHHVDPLRSFAWSVSESSECDEGTPYGVTQDGELDSCHETEDEAQARADELNGEASSGHSERRMFAVLCVEGYDTGDGRLLEVGGGEVGALPLPVMALTENPEWGGHSGAFLAGRWETAERLDDGRRWYAEGMLDTSTEQGRWVESQIEQRNLRFDSIDVGEADVDYEVRAVYEDGWPAEVLARFTRYVIRGSTLCPFPAIPLAVVWLEGMDAPAEFTAALPEVVERVEAPEVIPLPEDEPMLLASGASDALPPVEWFARSAQHDEYVAAVHSGEPQPRIMAGDDVGEGVRRVWGYIAQWGVCHIGMPGCVTAPRSQRNYVDFHVGARFARCCTTCAEQQVERVATGPLTVGTTHAGTSLSARDAALHYEHTGHALVDVHVGEDDFGIWFAGATRQGTTDAQIEALVASSVSGDWRRCGTSLELVAALSVNVPGFRLVASAHYDDDGELASVVAPLAAPADVDAIAASITEASPMVASAARAAAQGARRAALRPADSPMVLVPRAEWSALQSRLDRAERVLGHVEQSEAEAIERRLRGDG